MKHRLTIEFESDEEADNWMTRSEILTGLQFAVDIEVVDYTCLEEEISKTPHAGGGPKRPKS